MTSVFNSMLSCNFVVDNQMNTSRNVGIFASWKEGSLWLPASKACNSFTVFQRQDLHHSLYDRLFHRELRQVHHLLIGGHQAQFHGRRCVQLLGRQSSYFLDVFLYAAMSENKWFTHVKFSLSFLFFHYETAFEKYNLI